MVSMNGTSGGRNILHHSQLNIVLFDFFCDLVQFFSVGKASAICDQNDLPLIFEFLAVRVYHLDSNHKSRYSLKMLDKI